MIINISRHIGGENVKGHLILHCLEKAGEEFMDEVVEAGQKQEAGVVADVSLTINGEEVDFESFVDFWESQVDRIVEQKAKHLLNDKLVDLQQSLQRVEEEIDEVFEAAGIDK